MGLTKEQVDKFHEDGFLVVEGFATKEEVEGLHQRGKDLLNNFDAESISIFSTKNQSKLTDDYFFKSASTIGFFFEEEAFDEGGKLKQSKELSINKIGHALHDLDPVFRSFSRSDKVKAVLKSLGYKKPLPVQSMYICKQPKIGGEVVPHQDTTFLHTDPPSVMGLWWALEDATCENGCLWGLPASHKEGEHKRFVKEGGAVTYDKLDKKEWDLSKFVPLPVKAGSLVLLHGSNVHYSAPNRSSASRHAYSIHVVEGEGCTWSPDNWLQRPPELPFEPMYSPGE